MASSLDKETGDTSTADSNKAYFNGGSRGNKRGNGNLLTEGRVFSKEPICYGCGQEREQKLLYMWGFWTYSKVL